MTRETTSIIRFITRTGLVPSTLNPAANENTASMKKNVVYRIRVMLTLETSHIRKTESRANFTSVVHMQNTIWVADVPTPTTWVFSVMVSIIRMTVNLKKLTRLADLTKEMHVLATRVMIVMMVATTRLSATLLHVSAMDVCRVVRIRLWSQTARVPTVVALPGVHEHRDRLHRRRLHVGRRRPLLQQGLLPFGRRLNATSVFPPVHVLLQWRRSNKLPTPSSEYYISNVRSPAHPRLNARMIP